MTRVIIADDHALIAEAFQKLLEPECEVVATVTDGRALIAAARDLRPDVIVLDIAMPLLNGLDAASSAKRKKRSLSTLLVAASGACAQVLIASISKPFESQIGDLFGRIIGGIGTDLW